MYQVSIDAATELRTLYKNEPVPVILDNRKFLLDNLSNPLSPVGGNALVVNDGIWSASSGRISNLKILEPGSDYNLPQVLFTHDRHVLFRSISLAEVIRLDVFASDNDEGTIADFELRVNGASVTLKRTDVNFELTNPQFGWGLWAKIRHLRTIIKSTTHRMKSVF